MTTSPITSFTGKYRFLSNFYDSPIYLSGTRYATVEHAYQALKADTKKDHDLIMSLPTPGEAKRAGSSVSLRPDWDLVKVSIMRELVEAKFDQNSYLMSMLKETSGRELIEGNGWGDTFWGQSPVGTGRNELGKILMSIRDDITKI